MARRDEISITVPGRIGMTFMHLTQELCEHPEEFISVKSRGICRSHDKTEWNTELVVDSYNLTLVCEICGRSKDYEDVSCTSHAAINEKRTLGIPTGQFLTEAEIIQEEKRRHREEREKREAEVRYAAEKPQRRREAILSVNEKLTNFYNENEVDDDDRWELSLE